MTKMTIKFAFALLTLSLAPAQFAEAEAPSPSYEKHSCDDSIRNGGESDIDCGGPDCLTRCGQGQKCNTLNDCKDPLLCDNGICKSPEVEAKVGSTGAIVRSCGANVYSNVFRGDNSKSTAVMRQLVLCGPGYSCRNDNDCKSQLFCTAPNNVCDTKQDDGEKCDRDRQCQSGSCNAKIVKGRVTKTCAPMIIATVTSLLPPPPPEPAPPPTASPPPENRCGAFTPLWECGAAGIMLRCVNNMLEEKTCAFGCSTQSDELDDICRPPLPKTEIVDDTPAPPPRTASAPPPNVNPGGMPEGSSCVAHSDCYSTWCTGGNGKNPVCDGPPQGKGRPGDDCNNGKDCLSGYCVASGIPTPASVCDYVVAKAPPVVAKAPAAEPPITETPDTSSASANTDTPVVEEQQEEAAPPPEEETQSIEPSPPPPVLESLPPSSAPIQSYEGKGFKNYPADKPIPQIPYCRNDQFKISADPAQGRYGWEGCRTGGGSKPPTNLPDLDDNAPMSAPRRARAGEVIVVFHAGNRLEYHAQRRLDVIGRGEVLAPNHGPYWIEQQVGNSDCTFVRYYNPADLCRDLPKPLPPPPPPKCPWIAGKLQSDPSCIPPGLIPSRALCQLVKQPDPPARPIYYGDKACQLPEQKPLALPPVQYRAGFTVGARLSSTLGWHGIAEVIPVVLEFPKASIAIGIGGGLNSAILPPTGAGIVAGDITVLGKIRKPRITIGIGPTIGFMDLVSGKGTEAWDLNLDLVFRLGFSRDRVFLQLHGGMTFGGVKGGDHQLDHLLPPPPEGRVNMLRFGEQVGLDFGFVLPGALDW